MLNQKQISEIRQHLENSTNPLFFFDNDADGLCSFLILRRALDRGRGVPIKSFPELKEQYLRKVEEIMPDAIFILDKAEVSEGFILSVKEKGLPIIWIDHHESKTPKEIIEKTFYYNTLPDAEPITYVAQKIYNKKEDLWLALIGCVGDAYMPDFADAFEKESPELFNSKVSAFDALQSTEIGKAVRMLNFGLMDTTTNVISFIKYLFKAKSIYDIFEENYYTRQFHKRYKQLNDFYIRQVNKAKEGLDSKSKILFFSYSGDVSMSSEISNNLYYNYPDKVVVVSFKRPEKINVSIRGKNALEITKKVIPKIEGATGGGHKEATGAMIPVDKFEDFKKEIYEVVG